MRLAIDLGACLYRPMFKDQFKLFPSPYGNSSVSWLQWTPALEEHVFSKEWCDRFTFHRFEFNNCQERHKLMIWTPILETARCAVKVTYWERRNYDIRSKHANDCCWWQKRHWQVGNRRWKGEGMEEFLWWEDEQERRKCESAGHIAEQGVWRWNTLLTRTKQFPCESCYFAVCKTHLSVHLPEGRQHTQSTGHHTFITKHRTGSKSAKPLVRPSRVQAQNPLPWKANSLQTSPKVSIPACALKRFYPVSPALDLITLTPAGSTVIKQNKAIPARVLRKWSQSQNIVHEAASANFSVIRIDFGRMRN